VTHHEVVLPRRAAPQPQEKLVAIGDCGACVLSGLLGIPSLREVYSKYGRQGDSGGLCQPLGWYDMQVSLRTAQSEGLLNRVLEDPPIWPHSVFLASASWGLTSWQQQGPWWAYTATLLDSGCYGLAHVRMDGTGPLSEGANHWVLLCGYRTGGREDPNTREILVSCPALYPEGMWMGVRPFLQYFGGLTTLFARPTKE
jgi:hypothetical protein